MITGALLLCIALGSRATEVNQILEAWAGPRCYNATIEYQVWMPRSDDPVSYRISANQRPATSNPELLPIDYIIDWEYLSGSNPTHGFSAYTGGHHFRYNGHGRLKEYNLDSDSSAFHARNPAASVQRSAQFVSLLPAVAAIEMRELLDDSAWTTTVRGSKLTAEMRRDGSVVNRRSYTLDEDLMPRTMLIESNIGAVSEQTVEAKFKTESAGDCDPVTEAGLMARYPEIFDRYRTSNYNIHNLTGQPLPQIALNTPTGERYQHLLGDGFRRPTIIALLDPRGAASKKTVDELRTDVEKSGVGTDLIFAVTQPDIDLAESLLGPLREGEHHLIGARTWVAAIGATKLPVVLVCDSNAIVKNVIEGHNKDLPTVVIELLKNIN